MTVVNLKPDTAVPTGTPNGWTLVSGATGLIALTDGLDTTYITDTNGVNITGAACNSSAVTGATTNGGGYYGIPVQTFTLPNRAVVTKITPKARYSQATADATVRLAISYSFLNKANYTPQSHAQLFSGPQVAIANVLGLALAPPLASIGHTTWQAAIDDLCFSMFQWGYFANSVHRIYEASIDVEYDEIPVAGSLAFTVALMNTLTTRPAFSWTYSDVDAGVYAAYRLVIHEKNDTLDTVYQAALTAGVVLGDFVNSVGATILPKSGTGAAADGLAGDVTRNATELSFQTTRDLVNGTTYRAYLQVAQIQGTGLLWSDPIFLEFTENVALPPTPIAGDLVATYDAVTQLVSLATKTHLNMLTTNQASLEADTTGWVAADANTTISRSLTFASDGVASLRLASVAAGTVSGDTSTLRSACLAGISYSGTAVVRSAVIRSSRLDLVWYNAAGSVISTTTGSASNSTTGGFTAYTVTGTAPALAVTVAIKLVNLATAGAAEFHYWDKIQIAPGVTTWSRGGLIPVGVLVIERSADAGFTWWRLPAGDIPVDAADQLVTAYDTVAPIGRDAIYRLSVRSTDAGFSLQSVVGPSTTPLTCARARWMLLDPLDPVKRAPLQITGNLVANHEENQGAFVPLGGDRFIVVSDRTEGPAVIPVSAIFKNEVDWQVFQTLRREHHILALTGDYDGAFWWVRIAPAVQTTLINNIGRKTAITRARYEDFTLLEVNPDLLQPRIP